MMHIQDKRISVKRKLKQAERELSSQLTIKKCLICGDTAEYCMRGIPNNAYCKNCAQDYFKLLSYLERL